MRCIDNPHTDPLFNLAAEDYLFHYLPDSIFMLWQNDPAVIIGKHQDVQREVNLAFAQAHALPIVRRFSGGGTVYQDLGNLNLTFIENTTRPDFGKYTRLIQDFLRTYSIFATVDARQALFINNLKISGCAQYIRKGRILHHATLLYSTDLPTLSAVLEAPDHPYENTARLPGAVKSVKSPVTNLSFYLPSPPSVEAFRKTLFDYFVSLFPSAAPYFFTKNDLEIIKRLRKEKYANPSWILRLTEQKENPKKIED